MGVVAERGGGSCLSYPPTPRNLEVRDNKEARPEDGPLLGKPMRGSVGNIGNDNSSCNRLPKRRQTEGVVLMKHSRGFYKVLIRTALKTWEADFGRHPAGGCNVTYPQS